MRPHCAESAARKARGEEGQSLVELALLVPILAIMLACAVDFGRFMMLSATVQSAADSLAGAVESSPVMTAEQAADYVAGAYPELASAAVSVGEPAAYVDEEIPYKIYNPAHASAADEFNSRPSRVMQDSIEVRVEYTGTWVSPGLIAGSNLVGQGGTFALTATSTALVDKTLEGW